MNLKKTQKLKQLKSVRLSAKCQTLSLAKGAPRADRSHPIRSFARTGVITYTLHPPGLRRVPIDTRGEYSPDTISEIRDRGTEEVRQSEAVIFQQVFATEIAASSQLQHPDGKTRVLAERGLVPMQVQGVNLAGGRRSPTMVTTPVGEVNISSSNEVVFGASSDPTEHYLFLRGPLLAFDSTFHPKAKRLAGKLSLTIFNVTDNTLLGDFDPTPSPDELSYYAIQHEFSDLPLQGKTIRFTLRHTIIGQATGPEENQWVLMGAWSGMSILKVKRK